MSPSKKDTLATEAEKLLDADVIEECNHTAGKGNVIVDTLSRPNDCMFCLTTVNLPAQSPSDIRANQLEDQDVKKRIEDMESDDPFRGRPWVDRGYVLFDGVLFRYGPEGRDNEGEACLVVPRHERCKVLQEFHDAPTAAHYGVEHTLARISARFYWPGMRLFISNYIKECPACQKYKRDNRKPADLVLLKTQGANDTSRGQTPKFIPRRDGPYRVREAVSPTTYLLERMTNGELLGKHHASQLTPFVGHIQAPVREKRRRGRPRKIVPNPNTGSHSSD